jgi:Aminotransferase class I and II
MPCRISQIVQALEPSATLAMAAKAKQLKAEGHKVHDFSVGEPDFRTPDHICQAAVEALQAGHTHYTQASGIPELRTAIARQYESRHGLKYTPAQVVVSNGAKHSLHNVFTALCNPGDEVVIPAPYWVIVPVGTREPDAHGIPGAASRQDRRHAATFSRLPAHKKASVRENSQLYLVGGAWKVELGPRVAVPATTPWLTVDSPQRRNTACGKPQSQCTGESAVLLSVETAVPPTGEHGNLFASRVLPRAGMQYGKLDEEIRPWVSPHLTDRSILPWSAI